MQGLLSIWAVKMNFLMHEAQDGGSVIKMCRNRNPTVLLAMQGPLSS